MVEFIQVLEAFKNGSLIKRKWWNQYWKYEGKKKNKTTGKEFDSAIKVDEKGNFKGYVTIYLSDILADDWEIMQDETENDKMQQLEAKNTYENDDVNEDLFDSWIDEFSS